MRRALLAASLAMAVAGTAVLFARTQQQNPGSPGSSQDPYAAFDAAVHRHDYRRAYALTDLPFLKVTGASSAVSLAHFTAFARAHAFGRLTIEQEVVHISTTDLHITAPTGPLPSVAVDGVPVMLRARRVSSGQVVAALWRYRYVVVVILGPHILSVDAGPVTAARTIAVGRGTVDLSLPLVAGARGNEDAAAALHGIVGTCPADTCVVAPCTGGGPEFVLDASGIGLPPIVARAIVGDRVIAPMPPDGWSIAITFVDLGQPPGLGGKEQTRRVRARYVFGFDGGGRARLLDRCWVSHD